MAEHSHPEIEAVLNRVEAWFATSHQMMGHLAPAEVLATETLTIPAWGVVSKSWQVRGRAVMATNLSGTALVVHSGAPTDSPPQGGAGVVKIGPGGSATVPLDSSQVSVWGRPGAQVVLSVLTKPVAPVSSPRLTVASSPFAGGTLLTPSQASLVGFSLRETSGTAAAIVRLRDGSAAGAILDEVSLAAAESARECYPHVLSSVAGVWGELVSGAVEGTVRWA